MVQAQGTTSTLQYIGWNVMLGSVTTVVVKF